VAWTDGAGLSGATQDNPAGSLACECQPMATKVHDCTVSVTSPTKITVLSILHHLTSQ